jgi:hypothetical protein
LRARRTPFPEFARTYSTHWMARCCGVR